MHSLDEGLFEVIPRLITTEDNTMLTAPTSLEELMDTVFGMSEQSAPGPDGFSGKFFHAAWDIIKLDLLEVANFYLQE